MKGVVLEIRKNRAAVLMEDGGVVRKWNRGYQVGQEVRFEDSAGKVVRKAGAVAAAVTGLALAGGAGVYAAPYSYVSLDVNPSIEYTVNVFDRVIAVEATDEEGAGVLDGLQLRNRTIDEAVGKTCEAIRNQGYFNDGDPDGVVVAASCRNSGRADELAARLGRSLEADLRQDASVADVECFAVSSEERLQARNEGLTMGRYRLIERIRELAGSASAGESLEGLTVHELMAELVKQEGLKARQGQDGSGSNQGTGNGGAKQGW